MTAKKPPVPKANRSDKGPGEDGSPSVEKAERPQSKLNADKQGQQANTKINTTHQGLQQDR
ncbi:hypothetical protein [Brucella cytisi]|uniref:hypothetical protein n=1 Tax=Brucella cytisi TaxID=407152 RepID=UPI0008FC444F|nr:hypothetical protein [Brucella cytisi]